jgi:menaquinone-specific isochorismate synthase
MAQFDIQQFLNSGAFIRLKSGKLRVWTGPFKVTESNKTKAEPEAQGTVPGSAILFKNFYGSEVFSMKSSFEGSSDVLETDVGTFRNFLHEFNKSQSAPAFGGFLPPSEKAFHDSFQDIMGRIQRGEIDKAVPIVFAESPLIPQASQLAQMIDHVLEAHEELFPFGFWFNGSGIIGATPEILFRTEEQKILSMALAGTSPADQINQLKSDRKEISEHEIVVRDIEDRLKGFGWVRREPTKAVKIGPIAHLRTEISVSTQKIDALRLIESLHPTAALGVYPRNYGIAWMKNLPYQSGRGVFGAPILFPISKYESICLVAIRCLQWTSDGSQIGTGCGIVSESQFQNEWEELALKRSSVIKVLGIS